MPEQVINESLVIDMIYQGLRRLQDKRINDVTMDNDNDSAEIILTTDDGSTKQCFVIRSKDIEETDVPGKDG